jgi:opacity protein-like surface antigen
MKKTLIALLPLAGITAAGTEETITLQPAPQTACTWQPEFSLEYLHGSADHKGEVDTDGIRAGFSIYTNTDSKFSHQFSLNLGYEWGDISESHDDGIIGKLDETKTSLTLGYDLNYALTEKFTVFVGAKAGWSLCDYEFSVPHYNFKWEQDMDGFTYSIGAGVKYQITESVHVKAGYELNRTYYGECGPAEARHNIIPCLHIISVGVGYKF